MTLPNVVPDLVRPAFFDGQRLDATDLAAVYAFHRELRWLHNRTLHGWGIATGLTVTGHKGGRDVTVSPGYALDCQGHDLVLSRATTLMIPPLAGAPTGGPIELYLTALYAEDAELPVSETRDGVCHTGGAVRRAETPLLRFQNPRDPTDPATRFRRGLDIVLATLRIEDCALAAAPSAAERRNARPATQPYLSSGVTAIGATPWAYFPATGAPLGVQTIVDTSAAAFRLTPAYSAQLVGNRALADGGAIIDGYASVTQATPTSFVLQVTLPRDLVAGKRAFNPSVALAPALLDTLQTTQQWRVSWMGVEP